MAIVRAVKSGNWSDTTVWNTGALPTSADDVYSNTFTVTIDTSITVLSIQNATATGVTAGGNFAASVNGTTITCTGAGIIAGSTSTTCLILTLGAGATVNIVSNTSGSSTARGIVYSSSGSVAFTGNSTGATNGFSGIECSGTGSLSVTGNLQGAANSNGLIIVSNSAAVTITGTITSGAGAASFGLNIASSYTGTLTHTGTAQASTTCPAISYTGGSSATVILSGPFLTSAQGISAILCFKWLWANASPLPTYYQIRTANLATIRPLYTADSVGGNPAASNVRSGTVYGPAGELTGTCAVPGAASVLVGVPVDATTGTATIAAADIRAALGMASANLDTQLAAKPTAAQVRTEMDSNSTKLANLDATVSSRSTYAGGDTTGTTTLLGRLTSGRASNLDNLDQTVSSRLAASGYTAPPSAASVASAVWASATRTLTAAVYTTSDIASAVWANAARTVTGGTVDTASNVPSASTVAAAVWAAASRTLTAAIDNSATIAAAVWGYATGGRTITGGTVDTLTNAPSVPSASTIASAVRTELTTELGRIDTNVSSRLAPGGTLARVTLTDTTTTLTNAPNVPSAATIASQVRTELATELARLDQPISSRLAPNGTLARVDTLTNAPSVPTPAQIASQVRTELTPELARVANAATTQEVAEIVQDASQP